MVVRLLMTGAEPMRLLVADDRTIAREGVHLLLDAQPDFLLVVAGVWSTYLYVISQIVGIWMARPNTARENQLRMKTRGEAYERKASGKIRRPVSSTVVTIPALRG